MEVLKLCASKAFSDKRVGYLALSLIFSENSEILMLVTQTLKNDLHNSNIYIASIALTAISNIASFDITRDLVQIVQKLIFSENLLIKKKAIMSALKFLKKIPDSIEELDLNRMKLFSEKSNSVMLSLVHLFSEPLTNQSVSLRIGKHIVYFEKFLRSLLASSYNPDYDISGLNDPILQINIISLLRRVSSVSDRTENDFSTIIQIASNIDNLKNIHSALLYECVKALLSKVHEKCFRTMAIDITGRFLNSDDNNFRYIALNTLSDVKKEDLEEVEQHQYTILDCLWDKDTSIGLRALDFIKMIVNGKNFESILLELIRFLKNNENNAIINPPLISIVVFILDKFETSSKKTLNVLIKMFDFKRENDENLYEKVLSVLEGDKELQRYFVNKMYNKFIDKPVTMAVLKLIVWSFSRYLPLLNEEKNVKEVLYHLSCLGLTEEIELLLADSLYLQFKRDPLSVTRCVQSLKNIDKVKSVQLFQHVNEYVNLMSYKKDGEKTVKVKMNNEEKVDLILTVVKEREIDYFVKAKLQRVSEGVNLERGKISVAVPKFERLTVGPTERKGEEELVQRFVVTNLNKNKKAIAKLKVEVDYRGESLSEVCSVNLN